MISNQSETVSVLLATYNTAFELTKRAIDSVLTQDYSNFEILLLDDGSDCQTGIEILKYCQEHENKITYLRHQNAGQSNIINKAISLCSGSFVCVIDADDQYKPNHISTCVAAMKNFDLVASLTETIVDSDSDFYVPNKYNTQENVHVDECILFATLFGKIEVFKTIDFKTMYGADSEFFEQASKKFKVAKLNSRTYMYYRNHSNSITATLKLQQAELS